MSRRFRRPKEGSAWYPHMVGEAEVLVENFLKRDSGKFAKSINRKLARDWLRATKRRHLK
jgi:hypothetical protein